MSTDQPERTIVLAFDDKPDERECSEMMLECDMPDYERRTAASAAEAIAILSEVGQRIQLLWADIDAPEIGSGNEVIRMALETYGVPHILVTSGGSNLDAELKKDKKVKVIPKGSDDRKITEFLISV